MINSIASSPLGFWAIAFAITAVDSVLWLKPGRYVFKIGHGLRTKVRIAQSPFLLSGKEPIATLFLYPLSSFFIADLEEAPQTRAALRRELFELKRLSSEIYSLSVIPLLSIMLMCVVGPLLSFQRGIAYSILYTMLFLYIVAVFGVGILISRKTILRLANRDILHIIIELAFCPFLLSNLAKKIMVCQQTHINAESLIQYSAFNKTEAVRRLTENLDPTAIEPSDD